MTQNAFCRERPSYAFACETDSFVVSGKRSHGEPAHRFALARTAVRVQRHDDLPRARHPRSHVNVTMRPTDFCQSTRLPELVPALSVFDLLGSASPFLGVCGAIEGSVVSRRSGSASAGHAATRRGFSPYEDAGDRPCALVVSLRSRLRL